MSVARVSRFTGGLAFLGVALLALAACGGELSDRGGGSGGDSLARALPDQPSSGAQPDVANVERKVVVNSSLQVEVEKLGDAYAQVASIARQAGGFVAESTMTGEAGHGSASMRIRVPASRHDDVVAQVRDLGLRVVRESTNSKEVTEEYTDLQARVTNLQRTEGEYQRFLAQAKTLDEVLNINNRLDGVRGQIEQTQGRIRLMDSLTEFAAISVAMVLPAAPAPRADRTTPLDVFASAWGTSTEVALALANVAAALAVVAAWGLIAAPLGLVGVRYGRRLAPVARRIMEW